MGPEHIPVPSRSFGHVYVDLVGLLPASDGFTYLFTVIDRTTRWAEAIPLQSTSAAACVHALFCGWIARFDVPAVMTSDRGNQFTSSLWAALCSLLGISRSDFSAKRHGGESGPTRYKTGYKPRGSGMYDQKPKK